MILLLTVSVVLVVVLQFAAVSGGPGPVVHCGNNANITSCASECPRTCGNMDNPETCEAPCKGGCECHKGYIFDNNEDRNCILESRCPPTRYCCTRNETIADSGKVCATCQNQRCANCSTINRTQCYCKPGYIRPDELSPICILVKDCPRCNIPAVIHDVPVCHCAANQ